MLSQRELLSSLGKMVNTKADFDQYLNSTASKKTPWCCSFHSIGLWNSTLRRWEMKVNSLLTTALQLSSHFSRMLLVLIRSHLPHVTKASLSLRETGVFLAQTLSHTASRTYSGIQISCYSFLALGQQGIWKGHPNWKLSSYKELYNGVQAIAHYAPGEVSSLLQWGDTKLRFGHYLLLQHQKVQSEITEQNSLHCHATLAKSTQQIRWYMK